MTRPRQRYRRTKPHGRRPGYRPGNLGFDYRAALAVVRPELVAKLANTLGHEDAVSRLRAIPNPAPPQSDDDATAATGGDGAQRDGATQRRQEFHANVVGRLSS